MDQPLEEKVGATPKSTPLSCITITSSRSNSKQRSINKRGHNQGNFVKDICPPEIFPVFSLILRMTVFSLKKKTSQLITEALKSFQK